MKIAPPPLPPTTSKFSYPEIYCLNFLEVKTPEIGKAVEISQSLLEVKGTLCTVHSKYMV